MRNAGMNSPEPIVPSLPFASLLGTKGALRIRPHVTTQRPHVVLRRVKRIEVKPGKEILFAVETEDARFKDQALILQASLSDAEDAAPEEEDDVPVALPPKLRRPWNKPAEQDAPASREPPASYESASVQTETVTCDAAQDQEERQQSRERSLSAMDVDSEDEISSQQQQKRNGSIPGLTSSSASLRPSPSPITSPVEEDTMIVTSIDHPSLHVTHARRVQRGQRLAQRIFERTQVAVTSTSSSCISSTFIACTTIAADASTSATTNTSTRDSPDPAAADLDVTATASVTATAFSSSVAVCTVATNASLDVADTSGTAYMAPTTTDFSATPTAFLSAASTNQSSAASTANLSATFTAYLERF
ncbi:hypothetical protein BD626DRAFT_572257 [Schizophyllum amplum]|uniref:Uncharacterized protein n=1 Tax=Schizophyllum amplum TaxID=97359 RepID=A0A550C4Y8_9AGAR|nr:hypothetical protein BD626DRAFT_572257 [Auriculariopsis ampla]